MYLLLGTAGCHLCELAAALLIDLPNDKAINWQTVDIAEQTEWQADYAVRIPVLYHQPTGRSLCWPFDSILLAQFIQELTDD